MGKISFTRLELKRQREHLARFQRFLPALQLRQQLLQLALDRARDELAEARASLDEAKERFESYRSVMGDRAGLDLFRLAEPREVRLGTTNVAGVEVPVLEEIVFGRARYSLFATPAWVDRTLADMRAVASHRVEVETHEERVAVLDRELTRVVQRVNLFEKVKIPEAEDAIHRIRIHLGDEMAAAVGRAKIAKSRQATEAEPAGVAP